MINNRFISLITSSIFKYSFFFILLSFCHLFSLQVSPTELEEQLMSHPGIADVGVIGVPDERAGEVPRAFIVKRDANLSEEDVQKYMNQQVSRNKQLAGGVEFVENLPKNATGKLLRRELKNMYK